MYDAVTWQNLEGKPGAKAGYIDGPRSVWPAEAWAAFAGDPLLHITVLGNPAGEAFDVEAGNASPDVQAAGMANRVADRKWAALYSNQAGLPACVTALKAKGLVLRDAQFWPQPGVYLWAANPTGTLHSAVPWAPIQPVAVQSIWAGGFDVSWTYGTFPAVGAPAPVPPPQNPEVTVNVPQVSISSPGPAVVSPWVASVQALLSTRHGHPVAVDGRFGPNTDAAVKAFQAAQQVAVDGIVGPVTADRLCNR